MCHSCKNKSHLENVSQLDKWVTLKKGVTFEKLSHTQKRVSQLEKGHI